MWGLKYSEQRAKGADIEQWPNRWHQRYNQLRWPFPDRWQVTVHINVSRAQWLEKTSVANCCSFELKGTCRGVLVTYKWCFWTHRREFFIEPQETKLLVHKQNCKMLGKKTLQMHIRLQSHNLFHVYDERDDVLSWENHIRRPHILNSCPTPRTHVTTLSLAWFRTFL